MPLVLQQNELKSNDARSSTLVKTCAAENKLVSGWVKTDFWLDATHGSYVTCCKTSLPWAAQHVQIFFQKVEPLSTFCNNFSQPKTTWSAAGRVWFVGGERRNTAIQLFLYQCCKTSCTFLFSVLSYLYCQIHTLEYSSVTFFHDGHRRDRRQHGDGKLVSLVVRFKKLFFTKTLALHLSNEMSPNLD